MVYYNETINITANSNDNKIFGSINQWQISDKNISPNSLTVELKNGDLVINNGLFFFPKENLKTGDKVNINYFKAEVGDETAKFSLIKTITL